MLPRGQGKTSLTAVLALYELLAGVEGAQVVVVATDERQAGLTFRIAVRMVELHPELEQRVQLYHDHMTVPARGASFHVLPAVPKRLEGLDYTLALVDEAGRVEQDVFEVVALASGKQKASMVLAIGTPGPELSETVLGRLRTYAADHPTDPLVVWREHSAAGFEDHPVDCRALLGAGQPRPRRLPGPGRPPGLPAPEDARGIVPAGPAVPARRPARGRLAAPGRVGRLHFRRPGAWRTGPRSCSPSTAPSTATPPS